MAWGRILKQNKKILLTTVRDLVEFIVFADKEIRHTDNILKSSSNECKLFKLKVMCPSGLLNSIFVCEIGDYYNENNALKLNWTSAVRIICYDATYCNIKISHVCDANAYICKPDRHLHSIISVKNLYI